MRLMTVLTPVLMLFTFVAPLWAQGDERARALLAGDGMGLARAAEVNGYPGPKHVLELAAKLELSAEQRRQTEAIRASMLQAARPLGAALVEAERRLDDAFRGGRVDVETVDALTATVGRLQGELQAIHLRAHVAQRALLTAAQIERYNRLRGHTPAGPAAAGGHDHAH